MLAFLKNCLPLVALFALKAAATGCAADNCYRALFPCPSPSAVSVASAFCATITAGGTTATNYPTRATKACGTTADRYISACKCGPTCTTTPTATTTTTTTTAACTATPTGGGLVYGDFECGAPSPWTVASGLDTKMSVVVDTPGLTGNKSLQTRFTGPSDCGTSVCTNARIVSPPLPVVPGKQYKLTFGTWMDGTTSGFVGVQINGRGGMTVDALDWPLSRWHFSQMPWTAAAGETAAEIRFEWLGPEARLDTITFAPVDDAYCGATTPPLGIMPDGEFECGGGGLTGGWSQQVPDPGCTAGVVSVEHLAGGDNPPFGKFAWRAYSATKPDYEDQELGVSARLISPAVAVTPGKRYMLAFATYFDAFNIGFVGAMINDVPLYTRDPGDQGQGLAWFAPNQVFWTAPAGVTTARVKLEAVMAEAGTMMVDSVVFVEVTTDQTY